MAEPMTDEAVEALRWLLDRPGFIASDEAVRSLLARLDRTEARGAWLPIAEAPACVPSGPGDNGRRPVVVTRYPATGLPPQAIARLTAKGWISGKRGTPLWFEPTHWQPLPTPPSALAAGPADAAERGGS